MELLLSDATRGWLPAVGVSPTTRPPGVAIYRPDRRVSPDVREAGSAEEGTTAQCLRGGNK
jgi:hypothetical protein